MFIIPCHVPLCKMYVFNMSSSDKLLYFNHVVYGQNFYLEMRTKTTVFLTMSTSLSELYTYISQHKNAHHYNSLKNADCQSHIRNTG